jgi:hypothetical protein
MPSALTAKQWITIVLVNIIVSAVTTLIVVRVLVNQAPSRLVLATPPVVSTDTPQPIGAAQGAPSDATPTSTRAVAQVNTAPAKPSATVAAVAASSATPSPARATVTSSSTNTASAGKVRIGRVLFPGQRQRETVVIANDSDTDVLLKGWILTSNRNVSYTFGNVTLFRNNFINLHTTSGTDVPTDLFWNKTDPAWQVGDVLTLSNDGGVVTTYTVSNR